MKRALRQAARELLLLESSDWPFLVTTGQAKDYATDRFNEHHDRFQELASMIESEKLDEKRIAALEDIDNCFANVAPAAFSPNKNLVHQPIKDKLKTEK
jgi:1,4-alpha-glucan branching enzyme